MSDTDRNELPWDRPTADPADGDLFAQPPTEIWRTWFLHVSSGRDESLAFARVCVGRLLEPDPGSE